MPRGWYERCFQYTQTLLTRGLTEFDDPQVITDYFAELYKLLESQSDEPQVNAERRKLHYEEVAERFRMIKEDTVDVFVTQYEEAEANALLKEITRRGAMTRDLWRQAGKFSVPLYRYLVNDNNAPEVVPGLRVWQGKYDLCTGIPLDAGVADVRPTVEDLVQ